MTESSALIKLTKSEIDYVIIALVHAKQSAEHFSVFDYSKPFDKLRNDFIKINEQIIEGERNKEIESEQIQTNNETAKDCEPCD